VVIQPKRSLQQSIYPKHIKRQRTEKTDQKLFLFRRGTQIFNNRGGSGYKKKKGGHDYRGKVELGQVKFGRNARGKNWALATRLRKATNKAGTAKDNLSLKHIPEKIGGRPKCYVGEVEFN